MSQPFKRKTRNSNKQKIDVDDNIIDVDGKFSMRTLSENCFIIYDIIQYGDGKDMISIISFQCDSTADRNIKKGDGRLLMNRFLQKYKDNEDMEIVVTAVSGNQQGLNQYYKDIGFELLESFPRFANFKGTVGNVLYYTEHYVKNAKGIKKTRRHGQLKKPRNRGRKSRRN
jgi:hypothetical protein